MPDQTDTTAISAFHEGEVSFQEADGVAEQMAHRGRQVIRAFMPDQHRNFFCNLPFINLGVIDANGAPWVILRTGAPGFITSPDEITLKIASSPLPGEPENLLLSPGSKIGVVGVQTASRRRNRMNGTLQSAAGSDLVVRVDQSFGNCAKYIQRRTAAFMAGPVSDTGHEVRYGETLEAEDLALIARSDTLFIATRSPVLTEDSRAGLDVNHRGGMPGFVTVASDNTLIFPDYIGNNFFNTFGNIALDDRTAMQFIDFENGAILSMTGRARIVSKDAGKASSQRHLEFTPQHVVFVRHAVPVEFSFVDYWPGMPGKTD